MLILLQLSFLVYSIVLLVFALTNHFSFKQVISYSKTRKKPFVSILVPARNEQDNIEKCVKSLLKQDYVNYELLVLNDKSTDNTLKILKKIRAKNKKLKIIQGKALPRDWQGKHWACHQLWKKARGKLLLFTDADTTHSLNSVSSAVNCLVKEKADIVTLFPKQLINSLGEKLLMPLSWWSLFSVKCKWSSSLIIGQFMMFKREAYELIGGHERIKRQAVDDISLGHEAKKAGLRVFLANGKKVVNCRMFNDFKTTFNGFSRLLFPSFNYRLLYYSWVWLWQLFFFYIPIFNISIINTITLIITMASIMITMNYLDFSPVNALIYPLTYSLLFASAMTSPVATSIKGIKWKGRELKTNPIKI
jgi:chlorobactene glucosyltransferase